VKEEVASSAWLVKWCLEIREEETSSTSVGMMGEVPAKVRVEWNCPL
jgi:hypothetical protein